MVKVTCSGCRGTLEVPAVFVGRRVGCATCGAKTVVPEGKTEEIDVSAWMHAIDSASESETVSVEIPAWTPEMARLFGRPSAGREDIRPG